MRGVVDETGAHDGGPDRCWSCDRAPATTVLGTCEPCQAALQDPGRTAPPPAPDALAAFIADRRAGHWRRARPAGERERQMRELLAELLRAGH